MGMAVFWMSGLVMLAFEVYWFGQWWGGFGVLIGLGVASIAALFPFIYLLMGRFSLLYFGIWGLGVAGGLLATSQSE